MASPLELPQIQGPTSEFQLLDKGTDLTDPKVWNVCTHFICSLE